LKGIKILGTGVSLPPKVVTNRDLESTVDTSDEWIVDRTGIRERRIAEPDVATSDLCAEAVEHACADAGIGTGDFDGLIVATSTTDTLFPSTACWVQRKLGVKGMPAFDISAGCSGFLYGLEIAAGMIAAGTFRRVAVVRQVMMMMTKMCTYPRIQFRSARHSSSVLSYFLGRPMRIGEVNRP